MNFLIALVKKSDELKSQGKTPILVDTYDDAIREFGDDFRKINIDPAKQLEAGSTNPINGKFAKNGVAEALEKQTLVTEILVDLCVCMKIYSYILKQHHRLQKQFYHQ